MTKYIFTIRFQVFIACVVAVLMACGDGLAQNSTSSPFSILGIGEIETRDFGRTTGMGNVGIGVKSTDYLNRRNPAGLSGIDTLTFIFDLSAAMKLSEFSTATQKERTTNFNFKNIAVGFRVSKMWTTSVGVAPYSNVGYHMVGYESVLGGFDENGNQIIYPVRYTGDGGINKFYWANSLEIFRGLSIGATASYLFGTVSHSSEEKAMTIKNTYEANKIYFDFGMQYSRSFSGHTRVTVGGVYGYKADINMGRHINIMANTGSTLKNAAMPDQKAYVPQSFGAGFSILRNKRNHQWLLGADFYQQDWSVDPSKQSGIRYTDSRLYSVGLQVIPNIKRPVNYLQLIRYQIGASYNESYLLVNGHQQKDYSVSVGFGLPFKNRSYVNVALNLGQSATGKRGGITENYALLSVNFSLIEFWFAKEKYE